MQVEVGNLEVPMLSPASLKPLLVVTSLPYCCCRRPAALLLWTSPRICVLTLRYHSALCSEIDQEQNTIDVTATLTLPFLSSSATRLEIIRTHWSYLL